MSHSYRIRTPPKPMLPIDFGTNAWQWLTPELVAEIYNHERQWQRDRAAAARVNPVWPLSARVNPTWPVTAHGGSDVSMADDR